tara:strand:+ start:48009 stop:49850 length:1842 start_codon:yes stop_codon:yes gene_type:complete
MVKPIPAQDRFTQEQKEEVVKLFEQNLTQAEIAKKFDVPRRTMMKLFNYLGLKRTHKQAGKIKNKSKLDNPRTISKIREMRNTHTLDQIASEVDGSRGSVQRTCIKHNIELNRELFSEIQSLKMKKAWTDEKRRAISGSEIAELNDKSWLEENYLNKNKSMGEISRMLGANVGTISHHLKRHDIPLKSKDVYLRNQRRKTATRRKAKTKWGIFNLQSQAEHDFVMSLDATTVSSVENGSVTFEACGSEYVPDFKIDGNYVEIKPPEYARNPGINRQRFIKQWLIAKANGIDLRCWYRGKYYEYEPLNDEDRYFCLNWKLVFNNPNDCFEFLMAYGFKPLKWHKDKLLLGLNNVMKPGKSLNANHPNKSTVDLIKHFSQHFWDSTHNKYCTIKETFEDGNLSILRAAVEKLWVQKRNFNIYGLVDIIKRHYKDFAVVSIFKPWVARYIYERYLPDGGTIVDPCMGWGGRLLATLDSTYKYIGYDLNPNSIKSHQKLRKFIGSRMEIEPKFSLADSSEVDFEKGDLLFTSPPYDDCELYSGIDSFKTTTRPILENIFNKFEGIVVINLPRRQENMCVEVAKNYGFELFEKLEMKTASFMGRDKTYEPILTFKRGS